MAAPVSSDRIRSRNGWDTARNCCCWDTTSKDMFGSMPQRSPNCQATLWRLGSSGGRDVDLEERLRLTQRSLDRTRCVAAGKDEPEVPVALGQRSHHASDGD